MRRTPGLATKMAIALTAFAAAAPAHHGISNFDLNKDLELRGVVKRVDLVNPHSWLYLSVTGKDGKVAQWRCEMRSVTVLKRSGWTADMFKVGSAITVTGSPDRTKPNTCYLGTVIFADGSRMDRYGQRDLPVVDKGQRQLAVVARATRPARRADGQPNISGDWAAEQRVMTDPRGISGAFLPLSQASKLKPGEVPEGQRAFPGARGTPESLAKDPIRASWTRPSPVKLTEAGVRALRDFDAFSTDNPRLRCEPTNILFDWTFDTVVNRITQTKEAVRMQYGFMDLQRTIHLNLAAHPAKLAPSVAGHSIGRWENDVLVVDTVGFKPGVLSADANTLHSAQMHIVERFSLDPKTNALTREYVAEDPLYFEGQYKGRDTVFLSELPYSPYNCDDRSDPAKG